MLKEGKIGVFEATCVVLFMSTVKVLFSGVRDIVEALGPAAWYGTLVSAATALAGFYLLYRLMQRFPGRELGQVFETALGWFAGGLAALLTGFFFLFNAAILTREFVEAVKIYFYPASPPSFIMIFFILSMGTVIYFGFDVIARTVALFFWPLLVSFLTIFILAVSLYKGYNLFPLLGNGPGVTLATGVMRSSVYGDVLALAVVLGSLQGLEHFKKSGAAGVAFSGLLISASILFYTLSFPYFVAAENTIPLLKLTRFIEHGRFFQRFEAIFLFIWSISAVLAAGLNLYVAISLYCKTFRMDDHRVALPPLAVVLFSIAIILPDFSSAVFIYLHLIRQFGWIIYFGLPLLALAAAVARGKKGGPAGA